MAANDQGPSSILIVSSMYPTEANPVGGIFVHEQVKALRRRGIDARVVTGAPLWLSARRPVRSLVQYVRGLRSLRAQWHDYDGVPVCRFMFPAGGFSRKWNYPFFYALSLKRILPQLLNDFRYELVHSHTAYLDGRAASAAAKAAGVPLLTTEHTGPFSTVTDDYWMRLHTQAGIDCADRVVAVSRALKDDILAHLCNVDPNKLCVIPNGVDTDFFSPKVVVPDPRILDDAGALYWDHLRRHLNERAGQELTPAVVDEVALEAFNAMRFADRVGGREQASGRNGLVRAVWVGHHVDVKRVDRLLDAFAIAHRHQPNLRLTLVGNGPLKSVHEERAKRLGIDEWVRFAPSKNRSGVKFEILDADFLVLASEAETFGVVLIEALAMGRPVLATACGGPNDIVVDPKIGELVGNTTESIAIGLQRMVKRLHEFDSIPIRDHALSKFSFESVIDQLLNEYQLLQKTRRRLS